MAERQFEFAWRTDRGLVRSSNEDAVRVETDGQVVALADGIGGARAGEVASRLAVDAVCGYVGRQEAGRASRGDAEALAEQSIQAANRAVLDAAIEFPNCAGMGTTLVVGLFAPPVLAYAHIGDSRLYRLRGETLRQLTRDHSLAQEAVDLGLFTTLADAIEKGVNSNVLTRALGSTETLRVDSSRVQLEKGDMFLFCSDGLTNMLPDSSLRAMLLEDGADLEALADQLIRSACERGGIDNITLVLVRVL